MTAITCLLFSKPTEGDSKLSTPEEDILSSPQSPPFSPIKQTTNPPPALDTHSPTQDRPNNLSVSLVSAHHCGSDEHPLSSPVLSAHSHIPDEHTPALPPRAFSSLSQHR